MTSLVFETDNSPLVLTIGSWVDVLPQGSFSAGANQIQMEGEVEDLPSDCFLQLLVDGVSVDEENGNTTFWSIESMAAGTHTVNLQALVPLGWQGPAPTVTSRALSVYSF